MSANVKLRGKTKVQVKRKPIKAGSTNTSTTGGVFITKTVAIAKKRKRRNG